MDEWRLWLYSIRVKVIWKGTHSVKPPYILSSIFEMTAVGSIDMDGRWSSWILVNVAMID